MEKDRSDVHQRMDADYARYRLEPYQGETDDDGLSLLDGFKKFTSNEPRTFADKALALQADAALQLRVNQINPSDQQVQRNPNNPLTARGQREVNNSKELFGLGVLKSVNERRSNLLQPALQAALAWQADLRGRTAQRVLLIREENEEEEVSTYVDVTDWDPRNTYWEMGTHGIDWACYKARKTADQITAEYGVNIEDKMNDPDAEFDVYDYFDERFNWVILENGIELKAKTRHGMVRTPVIIEIVGYQPVVQHGYTSTSDEIRIATNADYGESIYHADRDMYDQWNFVMSVMAEMSSRMRNPPYGVYTQDGSKTLEENPWEEGTQVPLRIGEDVRPLPPTPLLPEFAGFMGQVSSMMQRGSFPHSAFGELEFQLSGFAINSLRQGMATVIAAPLQAMERALKKILDLLADSYVTGVFDTMTLSGRMQDAERTYFSQAMTPDVVNAGGEYEVELSAQLPQDDASRYGLAQIASQGPNPLLDHRFIREHILGVQDADAIEHSVLEQMAGQASPTALSFKMMDAAARMGEQELATLWFQEFQMQMMQKMLEIAQLRLAAGQLGATSPAGPAPSQPPGLGQNNNGTNNVGSNAIPTPVQGVPSPTPTPQQGPIAPRGTRRPNRRPRRALGQR